MIAVRTVLKDLKEDKCLYMENTKNEDEIKIKIKDEEVVLDIVEFQDAFASIALNATRKIKVENNY